MGNLTSSGGDPRLLDDGGGYVAGVMTRYQVAARERQKWLDLWQDCYDYTLPEHARFYGDGAVPNRKRDLLFDGTAADAVDQLAASLLGHLTPPWGAWFGFTPGVGLDGVEDGVLSTPLSQTTRCLRAQIDRSNLAVELHQCFLDLVVGGTACLQIRETMPGAAVAFEARSIPLSEVVLGAGGAGGLDHVYRRRRVTLSELSRFGFMNADDTQDFTLESSDKHFDIIEYVEPVDDGYDFGVLLLENPDDPILIVRRRLRSSPFIAFRWMKMPGENMGRSPVMKALPDIKTANKVVELILKNASIAVTGIWQAEDDGVLNPSTIELVPGAIIPKAVGSAGLRPLEMPSRFDVSQLVLSDLRARIRHALLVDRFAQIDDRKMTATEVLARSNEANLLLGAMYGRLQVELLTPLLTRLYHILQSRGEIVDLPLDGRIVTISYQSPLARLQAGQSIEPVLSLIDGVSRLGSGAVQTLNASAIARYLAEMLGVSMDLMNGSADSMTSTNTLREGT